MNILDLRVTSKNVVTVWKQDTENRAPYIGEAFFPSTKQLGLKFEVLKGKQGLPVALVPSNFNANVLYRDRIGVTELSAKLPFFKEAYKIDEELRQSILTAKDEYVTSLFDKVFDDTNDLLDGAEVSVERMRMQILSTGTINIQANGVDKQYDYGFDTSTQVKTLDSTHKWSATDVDPFESLLSECKAYKKLTKKKPTIALMNTDVFDKLALSSSILSYFKSLAIPTSFPTDEEVKEYVERRTGLTIIIDDAQYVEARDGSNTAVDFYPQDRFTLLATNDLGETIYGTTPEEVDLTGGTSTASSVEITSKGVAVTTWKEVDPVNVNVKVSEVVAPSCPNIEYVYIVKVL